MVTGGIEGAEVFEALRAGLDRARRELSGCQAEASQLEGRLGELLARRGEMLLQLARHYLPDISRPTIQRTFEGIRGDLLAVVSRREALQREIRGQLDDRRRTIEDRNAALDRLTALLNEKVALRERLEAEVAAGLKADDDFQKRSVLALRAEENLHRNEERAADMAREAAAKLPSYEDSRLFLYLLGRGFGTAAYAATGWARSVDTWVARMIDFAGARNGYDFLKKAPGLVAEEVARRRDQFSRLMQQVEASQKAEADRLGLTPVLQEGEALGAERDRLVREIEALHAEVRQKHDELAEVDRDEGRFYTEAVAKLGAFLGETRLAMLEQRARTTPEPEDDALVDGLAGLSRDSDSIQPRLAELIARRAALDRRQQGLDQLIQRFRRANYDSQRSYFEAGSDPSGDLSRFLAGQVDVDGVWRSIQSSQRFRPHWVESAAETGMQVISSPGGRILVGSLLDVAGQLLQGAAVRGVRRRDDIFAPPRYPSGPTRTSAVDGGTPSRPPSSPRPSGEGGFTSGEGF